MFLSVLVSSPGWDRSDYHVYTDDDGPWDFTGNQTDVGNNNNKFYILQLLESNNGKMYQTWSRWGRVGCVLGCAFISFNLLLWMCVFAAARTGRVPWWWRV